MSVAGNDEPLKSVGHYTDRLVDDYSIQTYTLKMFGFTDRADEPLSEATVPTFFSLFHSLVLETVLSCQIVCYIQRFSRYML